MDAAIYDQVLRSKSHNCIQILHNPPPSLFGSSNYIIVMLWMIINFGAFKCVFLKHAKGMIVWDTEQRNKVFLNVDHNKDHMSVSTHLYTHILIICL